MNEYDLRKSIELMNMVVTLLAGHMPEMYAGTALREAIDARTEMHRDYKKLTGRKYE